MREQEYADLLENAAIAIHRVASDGTILWANQAELDLLGYAKHEYIGHHIAEFHADPEAIADILERLARKETLQNYEARLRAKDGSLKHVLISSNVLWREGKFIHTRCFTRDITERVAAELQLKESQRTLSALAELSRVFAEAGFDDTRILDAFARKVVDLLGDACIIRILSEDGQELRTAAVFHGDPEALAWMRAMADPSTPAQEGLTGQVLKNQSGLRVAQAEPGQFITAAGAPGRSYAERYPVYSFLAVPLTAGGSTMGVVAAARHTPARPYTANDQVFLEEVSYRAALALQSARHHHVLVAAGQERRELLEAERKARQEAQVAVAEFRTLAETMPQMVWTGRADGFIDYANRRWIEYTGLDLVETQGAGWSAALHPEDHDRTVARWMHSVASGEPYEVVYRFKRASDGAYRWHIGRALPLRDEQGRILKWFGTCTDIHDQKLAEESLRMQSHILANMAEGVSVSDEDGFIIYTNPAEDRLFGYEHGELIGKHVSIQNTYSPEENERMVSAVIQQLRTQGEWTGEFSNRKKDGTSFISRARISALDIAGKKFWICVQQDVTQEKRLEEVERQRQEFEKQLIGIVSHDLRNPINAIGVSASLLIRRGNLDEQQGRAIGRILSSTERASRLIRDFLDFTQARSTGSLPVQPAMANLHEVVRQVVDEVHLAHPEREAQFESRGEGMGRFDPDRIAQLVGNLVGNAFQHSPPDTPVRVSSVGSEDKLTLSVHNEGPPIPEEDAARIFEPFQRGGGAQPASGRSVGLGLYISKQIVAAHGGEITVSSSREGGTVFTVVLPRSV